MINPITLIDGYKLDHRRQYPTGTQRIYSNFTPRTTRTEHTEIVFAGLQYFIKKYLEDEMQVFFDTPLNEVLATYRRRVDGYLGPNSIDLEHIEALWSLGYIPLEFRAFPEGAGVPIGIPALTVENTHDDFFWMPNYIETILSNILWLPCTSATTARWYRRLLDHYAEATGSPEEFVPWQGHDFSFRGMSGVEAACLSGYGHLISFTGTDTIPAVDFIERYYGVNDPMYLIGGSVAATEHSVMCAGGMEDEYGTFDRLIELYPEGIVSVVSDTWDLWNVINFILPKLQDKIMARDGKLVIRPDSGDPVKILCGDPASSNPNVAKGVVELLWDKFGGTVTREGFKVLDGHLGVIYGDSITPERAQAILERLYEKGFASSNIVFGIGSYTYQYNTRDTHGFAMKATWAKIDGVGRDMFKDPVTDDGGKKSAKGRLSVVGNSSDGYHLINQATSEQESMSVLRPIWADGVWYRTYNIEDVRQNAARR